MDSITQATLGAVVANSTGKKPSRKLLFAGLVLGTLPDLDVLLRFGDAIDSLHIHRGYSHSWIVQLIASPFLGYLLYKLFSYCKDINDRLSYRSAVLIVFLCLSTHSLIDLFTSYGTGIFIPLTFERYSLNNFFIIEPTFLFTLLFATIASFIWSKSKIPSVVSLCVISIVSVLSLSIRYHVVDTVTTKLAQQDIKYEQMHISPTPFNFLLWRVLIVQEDVWGEGYINTLADKQELNLQFRPRNIKQNLDIVERFFKTEKGKIFTNFNHGFYYATRQQLASRDTVILNLSDLRFGFAGNSIFVYTIAEKIDGNWTLKEQVLRTSVTNFTFSEIVEEMNKNM